MYQVDYLRDYIEHSELRIFKNRIKIKLAKSLAVKYDNGDYDNRLSDMCKYIDMINTLNITYPSNANPTLYIYIVPDDRYVELLKMPSKFDRGTGGGRPVMCYDLDGFTMAYGTSQNLFDKRPSITDIEREENFIHEFAHLVMNQFASKDSMVSEGFAEALPLYGLGLEEKFDKHRDIVVNLNEEDILSPKELIEQEDNKTFGTTAITNGSCSFRHSYMSSYLFVRGVLEELALKYNLTREESIKYFLNFIKSTGCTKEYLIFDIANELDYSPDELINTKVLQMKAIESIKNINTKTK